MHIHLPKPLHGWREFWGEVGIIALGILIALAAEQLIEWVHWREKVTQATDALHQSVTNNSVDAIEQQIVGTCIDRQLVALEARVTAPGPYRPATLFSENGVSASPYTVRAPSRVWGDGTWRIITGEGVSTHLPARIRERIDYIYETLDQMRGDARAADQAIWRLNSLSKVTSLEPETRLRLVQDIEELRGREALMTLASAQLLGAIQDVGMMPTASEIREFANGHSGTITFCRTHHLPLNPVRPVHV
ncbi:hypothetical protein [Sphingomonas bacterium]|uniref:hypothetical protein n=1 Tax=Sphingomonas bacterium TaxID=1895847 RepID=UPI0015776912|nr:hypothetical protein [Sphingomonas bacterium]